MKQLYERLRREIAEWEEGIAENLEYIEYYKTQTKKTEGTIEYLRQQIANNKDTIETMKKKEKQGGSF